ncbi:hypothetical protein ROHU_017834 [Labeo rohita]|uniref:Uncharacterized protein n=1 Tax=Labeo rohita TaxID=84645 RepID=A0A498NC55_LABRO|nr:hypothetical protein ROHU_017834 [Labeo rohita]
MAQRSNSKKGDEDIQSETARSRSSRSSGTTSSSKIGMAVAIAKAKAEAAQARAAHTQKEIELKVQQAHVQANLELHQPHSQPNDVIFPTPHPLNHSGSSSQKNIKPDPSSPACTHGASHDHSTFTGDLIKYLARSSLVTSGLTAYDDQPMNYWAWKTSFLNAIADLDLSAAGELDLLAKYLGKESAEQVRRIKTVNIKDPATGLRMAWERLDEIYGSPEAIEQALFNKLENFPKVTMKDPRRLRELADLLSELQAAKEDKYLAGLSYLDTSRGIRPIIEKLPYNLQEKWLYLGTRYKHEHFVSFPPFSVLVDFIATKQGPVYVHKTQISGTTKAECRGSTERIDPNKHCPLHRKPHPLRKCRGFHEKSINDRKQLLKEHYICFRCCSSTDHLAKNCTAEIKCTECGSTTHMTALHPYPPTWKSKSFPSTSEEGGEEDKVDIQEVKSTCTQVCGEGLSARTCAKICLVSVFPNGCKKESKRMYAILDEQSNRSLARSEFFEIFKISGNSYSYTLKTCAGHTETAGRRASGYTVASVDNKISIHLPTLLECNQIPNVRTEIPTPEAAFHHVHLKRIADKIPPLDPDAKILLLLGRDILQVHKVREQISGPGDAPFAQRLDLGWVVVGDLCPGGAHRTQEEDHRDFLRFLWYRNNDPTSDIVDYRMRVHLFGNSPSPAVAVYGLRRAAKEAEADCGSDARRFIDREFYVNDALKSFSTEEEAISVLGRAQKMLAASNLRLHKIASNRPAVIEAFPFEDRAKDVSSMDLFVDDLPIQRSLGLLWNMRTDTFTFQIEDDQRPFTRRGVRL